MIERDNETLDRDRMLLQAHGLKPKRANLNDGFPQGTSQGWVRERETGPSIAGHDPRPKQKTAPIGKKGLT